MPSENRIVRTRDVIFDESRVYKDDFEGEERRAADLITEEKREQTGEAVIIKIDKQTPQVAADPPPEPPAEPQGVNQAEPQHQTQQSIQHGATPIGGEPRIERPATPPDTTQIARTSFQNAGNAGQIVFDDNPAPMTPIPEENDMEISNTPRTPPPRSIYLPEPPRPPRHEMRMVLRQNNTNDEIYRPESFYRLEIDDYGREDRIRNLFGTGEGLRTVGNLPTTREQRETSVWDNMLQQEQDNEQPINEDVTLAENALQVARQRVEEPDMDTDTDIVNQ